jgi:hypothetical protein
MDPQMSRNIEKIARSEIMAAVQRVVVIVGTPLLVGAIGWGTLELVKMRDTVNFVSWQVSTIKRDVDELKTGARDERRETEAKIARLWDALERLRSGRGP